MQRGRLIFRFKILLNCFNNVKLFFQRCARAQELQVQALEEEVRNGPGSYHQRHGDLYI